MWETFVEDAKGQKWGSPLSTRLHVKLNWNYEKHTTWNHKQRSDYSKYIFKGQDILKVMFKSVFIRIKKILH